MHDRVTKSCRTYRGECKEQPAMALFLRCWTFTIKPGFKSNCHQ